MITENIEPIVKKKRINSKSKGNGYENTVSKLLIGALAPLKFRRSQSSGAILGGQNSKFLEQFSLEARTLFVGDLVPSNESDIFRDFGWKFRFTLECKFYKNCETLDHLFGNTKIAGWFEQAYNDSLKLGKEPLLIFKFNHTESFCACDISSKIPNNLSRSMIMNFPSGRSINIFLFKESLMDLEWWKKFETKV